MGIRVTARGLARLLPLAFIVAVPSLVSATPEHRDGAIARHAVLAARLDDSWLLLDNSALVLVPDHERTDYRPLIAFGAEADLTTVETALVDGPSASPMWSSLGLPELP